ncbi:hypothetical protein O181_036038 [Austropuccinia psidii MF-1]|uniref:Uncharacterized protein n=1 Tax=Austropuccinia psidii MF-1 TaxID=1389203 RepID=A0A9Q3D6M0_9BASI|nr:hypothetical protein [Austropuccinia psidii MF-1]
MEQELTSRRGDTSGRLGQANDEEGKKYVEEEDYEDNKVEASLEADPPAHEVPYVALSNQPFASQPEQSILKIEEHMTKLIGKLAKTVSPRDTSKSTDLKAPSIKAPYYFYGTQAHKLTGFIQ